MATADQTKPEATAGGYATLDVRHEGGVDWVTMNRPDRLNAMNPALIEDLNRYFDAVSETPRVRVVVLRGAGRAFCAGLDLREHSDVENSVAAGLRFQRRIGNIVLKMRRCPQPVVALVHGAASGGGFALALAADIRIAGTSARMNAAFIRIGLSACDIGVSYMLPRLVGVSVASELMMTGRFIHAERALHTGLVSEVVPDEALAEAARPYLDDMLTTSPLGLRMTKECLNASIDAQSLESVIAMEDRTQLLCVQTSDFREGVRAFLEKRPPNYADR
jgi:enoyl-CoA hydratase